MKEMVGNIYKNLKFVRVFTFEDVETVIKTEKTVAEVS